MSNGLYDYCSNCIYWDAKNQDENKYAECSNNRISEDTTGKFNWCSGHLRKHDRYSPAAIFGLITQLELSGLASTTSSQSKERHKKFFKSLYPDIDDVYQILKDFDDEKEEWRKTNSK